MQVKTCVDFFINSNWNFFLNLGVLKMFQVYTPVLSIPRNEESSQETRQQCVLSK